MSQRTVAVAVDQSAYSEQAFDCEYKLIRFGSPLLLEIYNVCTISSVRVDTSFANGSDSNSRLSVTLLTFSFSRLFYCQLYGTGNAISFA